MKMTDTTVRYVVAGVVIALLVGLGYASFSGKKQDEQFTREQAMYNQTLQHEQKGQYDQALPLLKQIEKEQPNSVPVKYYTGLALANKGDWTGAAQEFQNSINLNPYKVEDSIFMLQYAEVLTYAKKLEEAKVVLEHCKKLSVPAQMPDYQDKVNAMLQKISVSS
jgi:predicted Zn-dependent protease